MGGCLLYSETSSASGSADRYVLLKVGSNSIGDEAVELLAGIPLLSRLNIGTRKGNSANTNISKEGLPGLSKLSLLSLNVGIPIYM